MAVITGPWLIVSLLALLPAAPPGDPCAEQPQVRQPHAAGAVSPAPPRAVTVAHAGPPPHRVRRLPCPDQRR